MGQGGGQEGGEGGVHHKSSVEQQRDLAGDEGRGREGGEKGGGTRAVWEQQRVYWFHPLKPNNWSDLAGDEGGWGRGVGGGPAESSVGATNFGLKKL